jgi:hypothetical protein
LILGTNYGTSADTRGEYSLRVPAGTWMVRFSHVGFAERVDSVRVGGNQTARLDITLRVSAVEMDNIVVEERRIEQGAGVVEIDPETIKDIPAPFQDGFRILKLMPGVATNNELSNEYSVRGGGLNENLVFIDGFEVFKPFRARQGEQEGLGLVNPDLAERIVFYTGGFPARFGGKLSSALDVEYQTSTPGRLTGSAYASLLDTGSSLSASTRDGTVNWALGFRKAMARRLFGTQELKGTYDPDYTDLQGRLAVRLGVHSIDALGIWARHRFRLEPNTRRTYFGTFENLQSIWFTYSGEENDGYDTGFAGLRVGSQFTSSFSAQHGLSYFETAETEAYDVSGSAVLYIIENPFEADPGSGEGLIPTGSAQQEDVADNAIDVRNWALSGRYTLTLGPTVEAGWQYRRSTFDDRLDEKSVVVGRSREGDLIRLVADSLSDSARLDASMIGVYGQSVLQGFQNRLSVTAGIRADYYTLNEETTLSPRISARYRLSPETSLLASWGVYHQAPTYRELRGSPNRSGSLSASINRDLRAQRSVEWIAGVELFRPRFRLSFKGEAYYKLLDNLISYEMQNVRISYSGENDSEGFVTGFDFQLRGEFVPGLESWVNYGFMVARERFLPEFRNEYNEGWIARPTDQRHTISLYLQDYVPRDPTWRLHMRLLYGSGLPYTPPVPGERIGNVQTQDPGPRMSDRFPAYQRVDMGATKEVRLSPRNSGNRAVRLFLTAEVLNVFDMTNTVAYTWVAGSDGIWDRIPTRLTPRTVNVRARLEF